MPVSGLQNASLSQIISSKSANYSDLHDALCQCVRDMLAKYKQKPASGKKLAIKTRATEKLLRALCEVPKDQRVIRATILSALKSYAEALQGYEHLLSVKGNTYALIEQTQGLIKEHDNISVASLLQYHHLKNKLLGPDTRLSDEQREVISELAENKGLTLKTLEILLEHPRANATIMVRLHKAGLLESGLLEPDFHVRVLKHQHSSNAAAALVKLYQGNLLKPDLCVGVLKHRYPFDAAKTFLEQDKAGLCDGVPEYKNSDSVDNMEASAAELRYRGLKNKFLGPDTPLDNEQKKVLFKLYGNKDLTLKMLEAIDKDFPAISKIPASSSISGTALALVNIPESISIGIKNVMKKTGYHPNEKGICYGIAWAALLACVRQDGQAYMERMQYLKQMCIPPLRCADTYQVYAFFDAVTLSQTDYITMSGYAKGIGYPGRHEVAFPGSVIKSDLSGYQVVPVVKHVFIAECIPETFIEFLEQTLENNKGIGLGVMINYPGHSSSIGFDGRKWLAADHDNHYYTETAELLYTFLDKQSYYHKNGRMIAAIEVIAGNEYALNITKDTLAVNTKKSVSVPVVLHLALQYGDVNITSDCITVIGQQAHSPETLLEQLTFKNSGGTSGFYMALCFGYPEVITTFIQESAAVIVKLILPEAEKAILIYKLLASEKVAGAPALFMALQQGHSGAITAFIQACAVVIARLPLSKTEKEEWLCELLASKNSNDTPGFFMTLQKGHTDAVTAFIQESTTAISNRPLTGTEKIKWLYELLASKRSDGTPGFFMTLYDGHTDTIIAFIKSIAAAATRLSLSDTEKAKWLCKLLASKNSDGTSGFFMTLHNGHTDTVTAFIKAIASMISRLSLSKTEKEELLYELLACKRNNGAPGFYMALKVGHYDTISAFIKASAVAAATLSDSEEEKTELLYRLFYCLENENKPLFLLALKKGGPAVQQAFTEGIDQLPLSDKQKETLKYPTLDSIENMHIS